VILSGAAAAIGLYARGSYYVTVAPRLASPPGSAAPIVIYRGRPGGLLWFKPTLTERTPTTTADVLPSRLPDLQRGKIEASLAEARAYIANLTAEAEAAHRAVAGLPALPPPTPRGR
jgi:protein phosphatase